MEHSYEILPSSNQSLAGWQNSHVMIAKTVHVSSDAGSKLALEHAAALQ
jgi:hypothetical protein